MTLSLYKKKRSFEKTPEPKGGKASGPTLRFVVQKHAASHLHYDFRLEMEGVLKSWAIPKGPSMDPAVKRLAMMVEDHPYDYRTFEGIIPEGNYGAGTVIVWDEGTYEPLEGDFKTKKAQEKHLLHELYAGRLKFVLHGKKLKGEFALVKVNSRGENAWLLIKHNDKYATTTDITKKTKSVQSNKTLEEVEKTSDNFWGSNRKAVSRSRSKKSKVSPAEEKGASTDEEESDPPNPNVSGRDIEALLKQGRRAAFPADLEPMLATLVNKPFDDEDWLYEIKWDGYRALAYLKNGKVELRSRNNLAYNEKFQPVTDALEKWKVNVVVDGEIIALNDNGTADFQALQSFAKKGGSAKLVYYVFDLLWYDGKDYTQLPLIDRKAILRQILPTGDDTIRYSDHLRGEGKAFFAAVLEKGIEGIMAKKGDSVYTVHHRSRSWLKIKNNQQTEAIICGFTKGRNSRKYFGAVILGKYFGGKLVYIGHSGSGFDDTSLQDLYDRFKPLVTDKCPFESRPKTNMPVTWMKPKLVCEVKFTEWTEEKLLRHPIFLGLREDKTAANEKNEAIVSPPVKDSKAEKKKAPVKIPGKKATAGTAKKARSKSIDMNDSPLVGEDETQKTIKLNGHELKLTHLDKVFWPEEQVTKRDMLNYYHQVAPFILPYMKDRPQSLNRFPDGINGNSFFQKNVQGKVADWLVTHPYVSESDKKTKHFLVCKDEATLIYMASMGCIEMNPWHSRIQSPENPDWCVIDLDPDTNPFDEVVEAARVVKTVLDSVGLPGFCKTSGSTGLHIYIPLGAAYSYEQSKLLAELIVQIVHDEIPSFTSLERNPAKRKKKIYLDYLQNRNQQTIAAPYSLRPKPGATVSTPLHWEEVKKGLSPKEFTIFTIPDRLKAEGDLFTGVLGKGINLAQTLQEITSLFGKEKGEK